MNIVFKNALLLLLPSLALNIACSRVKLTMSSGFEGGTYNQITSALQDLSKFAVSNQSSKGTLENIDRVLAKQVDLAIVQADILLNYSLVSEINYNRIKIILPVFQEEIHLLASKEVKSLEQIKNKRFSIGPPSSGSEATSHILMGALGYTFQDFTVINQDDVKSAFALMNEGRLDALLIIAGAPVELLKNLDTKKFGLLAVDGKPYEILTNKYYPYQKTVLKKGVYPWLENSVQTIAVDSIVIARADIPSETVEFLLEDIFQSAPKLAQKHAKWGELNFDQLVSLYKREKDNFHPGAILYIEKRLRQIQN